MVYIPATGYTGKKRIFQHKRRNEGRIIPERDGKEYHCCVQFYSSGHCLSYILYSFKGSLCHGKAVGTGLWMKGLSIGL